MARLLRDKDYLRTIQSDVLDEIIESNQQTKLDVEQAAQTEMISYLAQRYITAEVFANTSVFDSAVIYKGKNLVEYTEPAYNAITIYSGYPLYDSGTPYNIGDIISYNGINYIAQGSFTGITPVSGPDWTVSSFSPRVSYLGNIYQAIAFTSGVLPTVTASWIYVCADLSLYFVTLPYNQYDADTTYNVGDVVWYSDKNYTAIVASKNILPSSNTAIWGSGVSYSVTGILPTDASKWTAGDNRNQQIVQYLLDITLYHLHSRLNPRNVPDLRKERYDGNGPNQKGGAIGWLKQAASGDVNADIPEIQPMQGMPIRSGNASDVPTRTNQLW